MKNISNLIILPAFIILILVLMNVGYKISESYKGPRSCLTGIENEKPAMLNNLAEIDTLNTRLIDDHWISAIVFRTLNSDQSEADYEVTFICHFEEKTHSYVWSEMFSGNEISKLKLTSTSIVNPQTW